MLDRTSTDWQALAGKIQIEGRDKSVHAFHDQIEPKTTWLDFQM